MIAPIDRRRLGAARVGAGAGLGEPEAAKHLAGCQERHEPPFLLVGAEIHDRRRGERGMGTDRDRVTGVDLGELVDDRDVRQVVHSGAPQLLRPRNPEQPQLGHLLDIVPGEAAVEIVLAGGGLYDVLGEIADHLADLEMMVAEVERIMHV